MRGGFQGGPGGGYGNQMGGGAAGGGRQLYISNVCFPFHTYLWSIERYD